MMRIRTKTLRWWQNVALLLVPVLPLSAAQTPSHTPARTPRTIVLPQTLIGSSAATLAVLDAAGRLMPGVMVELSGGPTVTTDATGRASFVTPPGPGVLVAWTAKRAITATAPIKQADTGASGSAATDLPVVVSIASYPQFVSQFDQFTLTGSGFRGIADANHVFLADQPCLVLASSPEALVVLPGTHIPVGAAVLRIGITGASGGGRDAGASTGAAAANAEVSRPVAVVSLEVNGPTEAVHAGALAVLTVQARGTAEPVQVELRNSSPAIVDLTGGNVQRIVTSGGPRNIAQVPMKFISSGDYTITAHLLADAPPPTSGT